MDNGLSTLRWGAICLAIIGASFAGLTHKDNQIASLKAQLQAPRVSLPIDNLGIPQPLMIVGWKDNKGMDHYRICSDEVQLDSILDRYARVVVPIWEEER